MMLGLALTAGAAGLRGEKAPNTDRVINFSVGCCCASCAAGAITLDRKAAGEHTLVRPGEMAL
jgi:hypothetical protein